MSTLVTRRMFMRWGASACIGSAGSVGTLHLLGLEREKAYFSGTDVHEFRVFERYGVKVPDPKVIDYPRLLWMQWLRKTLKYPGHTSIPVVGSRLSLEYEGIDPKRTTLTDYQRACSQETQMLSYALDYDQVAALYRLDRERLLLTERIAKAIDGRALLAIALTEHRVGRVGSMNKEFFDFRLRCGGSEFIERIPAGADRLVSYGPYQLTSRALYDMNGHRRGASVVNQALPPEIRVPGSVSKLRGTSHPRAAYLFAVHNMASFVSHLDLHLVASLAGAFERNRMDVSISTFVATSHYLPRYAFRAAHAWLRDGAHESFLTYTNHHIAAYAAIAAANHAAL